jgi:FdhE protein
MGGDAPPLRLPDPGLLFDARAARLRALAAGHAAPEWLLLLSRIATGQARAVREVPAGRARAPGEGPPLAFDRLSRDDAWRRMLAVILSAAHAPGLPVETEDALRWLAEAGVPELEAVADRLLAGELPQERLSCAPFVGGALQAWLAGLAAMLDPSVVPAPGGGCPVCGGPPVAGVVQGGDRLRYLTCALCAAEWNVPRVRCAICGTEAGLQYLHVEGDSGAKAEACRSCGTYVKLFDGEKRPGSDAAADDAATIALDLLVAEDGWRRAGVNLYVGAGVGG